MDLRSFDLNLLLVLHTLIAEQIVPRTALKLHFAVPATDGIVTIAARIAQRLAADYRLQVLVPPIDAGSFQVAMAWRSPLTNDPAIQWLRGELRSIASTQ
jgi:DNA-binding transcriptional LysR family regulator